MSEANEGAPEGVTEDTAAAETAATEETQAQGDEQSGDDAAADTTEDGEAKAKRKKTYQERIDEKTRETYAERRLREEAERRAEYWERVAREGNAPKSAEKAPEQPQGDGRPDPNDYANDYEYIEALTDWKAEQAAERLAERHRQNERATSVRTNFESRAKALFPEGEPSGLAAFRRLPELPVAVLEIVGESDIGPKLAAHLGDNPAELDRLARLSPVQQARELTRLETRLSEPPKPIPKTATDAPEPPPQARGAGGRFTVAPDTDDFAAFDKQYTV